MIKLKLNENEKKVLEWFHKSYEDCGGEDLFYPFKPIVKDTGLERSKVRLACRSLKRKEVLDFAKGLMCYETGAMGGAGYGLASKGKAILYPCDNCDNEAHFSYNVDMLTGDQTYLHEEDKDVVHIQECQEHYKKSIKHPKQKSLL